MSTLRHIPSHMSPATIELIQNARPEFEEWAGPKGYHLGHITVNGAFNRYMARDTDDAWLGYQAACKRERVRAAAIINRVTLPGAYQ